MRIMLDTNLFDRIADTPGLTEAVNLLAATRQISVFTTPIQEEELAQITDKARHRRLDAIRRTVLPIPDSVYAPTLKHLKDALIGAAAAAGVDVLVTEDGDFARRARAGGSPCDVWSFADLQAFVGRT